MSDYEYTNSIEKTFKDLNITDIDVNTVLNLFLTGSETTIENDLYILFLKKGVLVIKNKQTGSYITFNSEAGIMISYRIDNLEYYLSFKNENSYRISIRKNESGFNYYESFYRYPNKCSYKTNEEVYVSSEITIDAGNETDRNDLIALLLDTELISDFKNRFISAVGEVYTSIFKETPVSSIIPSKNKVYMNNKKQ